MAEPVWTAVEQIVDLSSPEKNVSSGQLKDLAAEAVLPVVTAAVTVGLIVLIPRLNAIL